MPPWEKVNPMCMSKVYATNCADAASTACTTYSAGATNRNANSTGSVMPVRNEVSAAEIMMPPIFARCAGFAQRQIASAAAGSPNILKKKAPERTPAVASPAKKRWMSPRTTCPAGSVNEPISKKKGTFQMWWRPNGMSRRSTNPYTVAAVRGSLCAAQ